MLGKSIGSRLFAYILLFSALLTLTLASIQLYLDYRQDLEDIERRVLELEKSSLGSISGSLWNFDAQQLRIQLEGIHRLPDILAVSVEEIDVDNDTSGMNISLRTPGNSHGLTWAMPIYHDEFGTQHRIGTLRVEASMDAVYGRLRTKAFQILSTQAIETFLIAIFIMLLVHHMVTRHLVALAQLVGNYDVRASSTPFRIKRKSPQEGDEIDRVVDSLESMRNTLEQAYAELRETNTQLEHDIAARQRAEAEAAHLAFHDPLTGLPNRRLLFDRLQHELSICARSDAQGALLFIDIDHFKTLNDARGHLVGDAVLIETSKRMGRCLRDIDLLARLGGDEFVVLLSSLGGNQSTGARQALLVAEKLRAVISDPLEAGHQVHHMSASIGVTIFPSDGKDIETLLKHADTAMYYAKEQGRNCVRFFQPALHTAVESRHDLELELRSALAKDAFDLAFQPLFSSTGKLCGAEVLLRWKHPTRGDISPAQFIPICEETGLIVGVGYWVLWNAARQLREWDDAGLMEGTCHLSVNISPRQFNQPDFVTKLLHVCDEFQIKPHQLILEITESVVMDDLEATIARMKAVRAYGLHFYIDDFGTGYSSMSYLKQLPVSGLKIDRGFIKDLGENSNDNAIVEAMLDIGHRFGLTVVAEGVETSSQVDFLRSRDCDVFQGYHFARPMSAAAFERDFLRQKTSQPESP